MSSSEKLKVGLAQMTSGDSVEENLLVVDRQIREAAATGAKLVAFPENTLFMRLQPGSAIVDLDIAGELAERMAVLCRELKIHVLVTTPVPGQNGKSRNSTIYFSPEGKVKNVYSKIHLFDVDVEGAPSVRESDKFLNGDGSAILDIEGWKFGLSICYDLRFAELYSQYAGKVDGIFVPSAFLVPTGEAHWHVLLRARAIENQCYVLAPAQGGAHRSTSGVIRKTYGHTLAVDPWGKIVSENENGPGVQVIELERQRLQAARMQIPMAKHRRMLKS